MTSNKREHQSLKNIKAVLDAYRNGTITITHSYEDFDAINHIYHVNDILGIISNHTHAGLGLPIPRP